MTNILKSVKNLKYVDLLKWAYQRNCFSNAEFWIPMLVTCFNTNKKKTPNIIININIIEEYVDDVTIYKYNKPQF